MSGKQGDDRMTIPLTRAERWAFCTIVIAEVSEGSPIIGGYVRGLRKDGTPRKSYHWRGRSKDQ